MPQRLTPITLNLIIINVLIFVAYHMRPAQFEPWLEIQKPNVFGFYHEVEDEEGKVYYVEMRHGQITGATDKTHFQPVQIGTSFFSHFDVIHLVMNMLALAMLGTMCELAMGPKRFIGFYLFAGLFSGLMLALFDPSPAPVLGASGAISGLLVVMAYYYPNMRLSLMFLPFQFTARNFAMGFAGFSTILILLQFQGIHVLSGISHFGHLMGMAAGFIYFNRDKFLRVFKR